MDKHEEILLNNQAEIAGLKENFALLVRQNQEIEEKYRDRETRREQQMVDLLNAFKFVTDNPGYFVQELANKFDHNTEKSINQTPKNNAPKKALPEKFSGTKEARNAKAWAGSVRNYLELL